MTLLKLICFVLVINHPVNLSKKKKELEKKLFLSNLIQKKSYENKNCSLGRSALVWQILMQEFYPIYERYNLEVPRKCKFRAENNMYYLIEKNKEKLTDSNWKCNMCGKHFYNEDFLHYHIDRKHKEYYQMERGNICLADYCDIFRCDLHEQYPIIRSNFDSCNNKTVRNIQRKCEKLMTQCLPERMHHYVYDAIFNSLCATLNCDQYYAPFEDMSLLTLFKWMLVIPFSVVVLYYLCGMCFDGWDEQVDVVDVVDWKRKDEIEKRALLAWRKNRSDTHHNLRRR